MTPSGTSPPPTPPGRVLVVDDQPANIQVVGSMLGKLGYEIVPASDGPTALKRLALRLPDLILLDVLMPHMDGFEICRHIRGNPDWKDIPIVFLSAADDKELIVRALDAGGVDFITKPFNHAELTSRVRTHLALKTARDALRQLAEDKDELLGILAHDLKNHLGGIQMSAQILSTRLSDLDDAKLGAVCDNIYQSSSQLLAFVKSFLANAAAEHNFTSKPEEVDLADAVSRAVLNYREVAHRKNLTFRTFFSDQCSIVHADSSALSQILDNLLSNAVKFSPLGKQISITVRPNAESVECLVQDQGPGFTPEDKIRMFRRYSRLSARPTAGETSTGLGLSIVKKLVQAINGDLTCESISGQGATFIIRLPRSKFAP